jgi:hypothetical protein
MSRIDLSRGKRRAVVELAVVAVATAAAAVQITELDFLKIYFNASRQTVKNLQPKMPEVFQNESL